MVIFLSVFFWVPVKNGWNFLIDFLGGLKFLVKIFGRSKFLAKILNWFFFACQKNGVKIFAWFFCPVKNDDKNFWWIFFAVKNFGLKIFCWFFCGPQKSQLIFLREKFVCRKNSAQIFCSEKYDRLRREAFFLLAGHQGVQLFLWLDFCKSWNDGVKNFACHFLVLDVEASIFLIEIFSLWFARVPKLFFGFRLYWFDGGWKMSWSFCVAPKYLRRIIYGKIKADIGKILRDLSERRGVKY